MTTTPSPSTQPNRKNLGNEIWAVNDAAKHFNQIRKNLKPTEITFFVANLRAAAARLESLLHEPDAPTS